MILTAEEFLIDWMGVDNSNHPNVEIRSNFIERKNQLISFAKLHVEAALKEASEKVTMLDNGSIDTHGMWFEYYQVDKDSILNAYPLTNIK